MAAIYYDVLTTVKEVLEKLPHFAKRPFRIRRLPSFVELQDQWPQNVIALREDLVEQVSDEAFENHAELGFPVYVGSAYPAEWDLPQLQKRLLDRQVIRLALWKEDSIRYNLPGQFDCQYYPEPGVPKSTEANIIESWQMFLFLINTARSS